VTEQDPREKCEEFFFPPSNLQIIF